MQIEQLTQNIAVIQQRIDAQQAEQSVHLIAVTKTVSPEWMRHLYQQGIQCFAENRTQMLIEKQEALKDNCPQIEWHFIGRLQTRQVKDVINHIDYLHSLDRLNLAKEIDKRAQKEVRCFVQVNVSGEPTKAGIRPDNLLEMLEALAQYPKICVVGLMTMAPFEAPEAEIRQQFQQLKQLQQMVANYHLKHAPCTELSMGMSQDYPIAIQEGATFIRVGSAFFEEMNLN
ncbi:YggS family pyridoxal phosphate-dependent enzyme [Aerococcaceae bacterium NML180378]|nr:YggS family pyridoxal phosphate-dependent enzyme [Aerococcaceae bacterium NML180378]